MNIKLNNIDSNLIFYVKCEKDRFHKFIIENELNIENELILKSDEIYIKKFKFYEYIVYFKEGYLVLETIFTLRQIRQSGEKYYDIDIEIIKVLKNISGTDNLVRFSSILDYSLPFRYKPLNKKCIFNNCQIELVEGDNDYCGKHLVLKNFKKWLYRRYINNYEWLNKIEILIY